MNDVGDDDDDDEEPPTVETNNNDNQQQEEDVDASRSLTAVEKLCLGRCHLGLKTGPDTVILAFGSGRPSTNGVLGFDLATDSFLRPKVLSNPSNNGQNTSRVHPCPRFTCAGAVFGKHNSYLLVHGGYSTQEGMAIGALTVLDLAPATKRTFRMIPGNEAYDMYPQVSQEEVNRHSIFGGHHFGLGGHGRGIGGVEDLLQNLFVEFAANAERGDMQRNGRVPVGRGRERLGELFHVLAGARRPPAADDDDEENDDDEEGMHPGGLFPGLVMRVRMPDSSDDELGDVDEDDEYEHENDDISEVS